MKKLIPLLLLFISLDCFSSNWIKLSQGWEIDKSTIRKQSNGNIQVWIKNVMEKDVIEWLAKESKKIGADVDYSDYTYSMILFEFRCSQREFRYYSGTDYGLNNRFIQGSQSPTEYQPIPPDSKAELTFKYLCK